MKKITKEVVIRKKMVISPKKLTMKNFLEECYDSEDSPKGNRLLAKQEFPCINEIYEKMQEDEIFLEQYLIYVVLSETRTFLDLPPEVMGKYANPPVKFIREQLPNFSEKTQKYCERIIKDKELRWVSGLFHDLFVVEGIGDATMSPAIDMTPSTQKCLYCGWKGSRDEFYWNCPECYDVL